MLVKTNREITYELLMGTVILIVVIIGTTIFNFLDNMPFLEVIFACVVAISTVVYAYLTSELVKITKKSLITQTEPRIGIYLKPREEFISLIDIYIENLGTGPANKIRFNVDNYIDYLPNKNMAELGVFKEGMEFLPQQDKRILITLNVLGIFEKLKHESINIIVTYYDIYDNMYESQSKLNFAELEGASMTGKPPMYKIVDELSGIKKEITEIKRIYVKKQKIENSD